jgi:hypothetical protein
MEKMEKENEKDRERERENEKDREDEESLYLKPRLIIENYTERFTGKLKFFDHNKSFGFIVRDVDKKDIFLH